MRPALCAVHVMDGYSIFAVSYGWGAFRSTDGGVNWNGWSEGLPGVRINALAMLGNTLVAGTDGCGVWRRDIAETRSLSKVTEGGSDSESNVAESFTLEQNYPNPFNPTTRIKFTLSSQERDGVRSHVTLKVYDLLGREVATLVNESLASGSYEVTFDARGLASGAYFYRLKAAAYVATRRMILVR